MDEALGGESCQRAPHDPMLQVQVYHVLVHGAGIVKRTGRIGDSPPIPRFLVALSRSAERVHGCGPGRVRPSRWSSAGKWKRSIGLFQSPLDGRGFKGSACIIWSAHEIAERK